MSNLSGMHDESDVHVLVCCHQSELREDLLLLVEALHEAAAPLCNTCTAITANLQHLLQLHLHHHHHLLLHHSESRCRTTSG